MRKTFLHKTISSVLVLIFFVISNVIVKAEQTNNNSSKKQNGKIKQFINDVGNRVNSGQIITQEQKNKIQEQINKKFNKTKPENIKKVFSGAIQEFNQATPEIKGRILNNVGSGNITKIKNQIENKKKEIIKDIKQDIQNQKNIHIEEAKKQFEAKKQEILNLAKSGKIGNEEAKKQILAHRNIMIEQTKVDIRVGAEKLKQEKISNVKSVVKKQFETKLADLNKLSNQQQKAKYIKLDASIDVLSKKSTQAQNEVYKIMREVLREKIDSLK